MPAARVSMRRVREILTLKCNVGPADPEVARVGVEHSTARLCLDRRSAALTDGAQEALLLAHSGAANRASPQGQARLGRASPRTAPARRDASARHLKSVWNQVGRSHESIVHRVMRRRINLSSSHVGSRISAAP